MADSPLYHRKRGKQGQISAGRGSYTLEIGHAEKVPLAICDVTAGWTLALPCQGKMKT